MKMSEVVSTIWGALIFVGVLVCAVGTIDTNVRITSIDKDWTSMKEAPIYWAEKVPREDPREKVPSIGDNRELRKKIGSISDRVAFLEGLLNERLAQGDE